MQEVKISLTIALPGRVIRSLENATLEKHSMTLVERVGKNKINKHTITYSTPKAEDVIQVLNMNKEAYKYMTSNETPSFMLNNSRDWKNMSKKKKLEMHLNETAKSLGGKLLFYHVFDD